MPIYAYSLPNILKTWVADYNNILVSNNINVYNGSDSTLRSIPSEIFILLFSGILLFDVYTSLLMGINVEYN